MSNRVGARGRIDQERVGDHVVIYRTPASPRWYMQFNQDAKQFKVSLKTTSRKQATILAKKKDAELTLGVAAEPAKRAMTVVTAVGKYLESQARHIKAKTLALYKRDLSQLSVWLEDRGITHLSRVDAELLEEYERALQLTGPPGDPRASNDHRYETTTNKPATIRGKMKTIRQLMNWARRRDLISKDPAAGYRLPPEPDTGVTPYTPEELAKILKAAPPPYDNIFNFLRLTGLRNDELCWLTKNDVAADLNYIIVQKKTCPFTGEIWDPKHGNERVVPLGPEAAEIVRRAMASSPGPWVFHAPDTSRKRPGHFTTNRIWKQLKKALAASGITHGCVHTFRHNYCSFLANKGVSPFLVMKYLGHTSLDIVMTYYHAGRDELLAGIAGVDFAEMLDTKAAKTRTFSPRV